MSETKTQPRIISGLGAPPPVRDQSLNVLALDQRTYARALDCVHCGLCLPACPTYTQNGLEADSPRGRIFLIKGLADGIIEPTESVKRHLDLCLDCRACETACPSGVVYHELIEEMRIKLMSRKEPTVVDRLVRFMFFRVFPYPTRLKLAMIGPRILQKLRLWGPLMRLAGKRLPVQLEKMQQMLPGNGPLWEGRLARRYAANRDACVDGKPRATVGLLAGCVGSVLFQDVNRQTIRLLQRAGCDVLVPRDQRCCGAVHHHGGEVEAAQQLARDNIDAFAGAQVDYIANNAAGCGAMLKDYAHLLRDDERYATRAVNMVKMTRDICELLVELNLAPPTRPLRRTVTYHDACHLAHAQKVVAPPRRLLTAIPGLKLIPLPESDMCCGAAGTYNLSQPDMARQLAERKLRHIQSTGATTCVTANVGCAMQIESEARRLGMELKVVHPVTLLDEAYGR